MKQYKGIFAMDESSLKDLNKLIQTANSQSETDLEASIEAGLIDIQEGRTYAHEDVQIYIRKKYGL